MAEAGEPGAFPVFASDVAGVILVWKYGWPQPSHDEGVRRSLQDNTPLPNGRTVREQNLLVRARRFTYTVQSSVGMALMIAGFVFQTVATWI
jgi:hypothetical protein